MTPDTSQYLLDRAAIYDLFMRYFNAADRGQKELVRECFTADVCAQYEGRPPIRGVDALMDQIALFNNLASGTCRVATHFAGNVVYRELSGDQAETENNVIAFLVNAEGTTVAMRSIRHLDRLRRVDGRWKIYARVHTLDWSGEVPCSFARPFLQKVQAFPAEWPCSL